MAQKNDTSKGKYRLAALAAAGGWMLLSVLLLSFDDIREHLGQWTAGAAEHAVRLLFDVSISSPLRMTMEHIAGMVLVLAAGGVLALLLWNVLRLAQVREKRSLLAGAATAVLMGMGAGLAGVFLQGFSSGWYGCFFAVGGLCAAGGILIWTWLWRRFPRVFNRETVSYIFFGALTTLVNVVVYAFFYNVLQVSNLLSTATANITAILFAYVVNKWFVFRSRTSTWRQAGREFALFVGARTFSLAVDVLGMGLLVDIAGVNGGVSKIIVNVAVLVLNYIFSKRFIFNSRTEGQDDRDE